VIVLAGQIAALVVTVSFGGVEAVSRVAVKVTVTPPAV
jgi:MFS-type transporter involved in bile tolerance (Atg22 family)